MLPACGIFLSIRVLSTHLMTPVVVAVLAWHACCIAIVVERDCGTSSSCFSASFASFSTCLAAKDTCPPLLILIRLCAVTGNGPLQGLHRHNALIGPLSLFVHVVSSGDPRRQGLCSDIPHLRALCLFLPMLNSGYPREDRGKVAATLPTSMPLMIFSRLSHRDILPQLSVKKAGAVLPFGPHEGPLLFGPLC